VTILAVDYIQDGSTYQLPTTNSQLSTTNSIRLIRDFLPPVSRQGEDKMQTAVSTTQETQLLSYVIASSDMRYIEVNRRNVHLRHDLELGLVIRGEIPDSLPSCDAGLAFMLLEYAMSCQDCKDRLMTAVAVDRFGECLGRALVDHIKSEVLETSPTDRLIGAFEIVLRSMGSRYTVQRAPGEISFTLAGCPLHAAAGQTALNLQVAMGHRAFVALCDAILAALAPDWTRVKPAERDTEEPLLEMLFRQKQ
jgi:hypothetical protein